MSPAYQCPKCGSTRFVAVCPVFSYTVGFGRPKRVQVGDLVRCTRHACGRAWEVTRDGLAEPAEAAIPGRTLVRTVEPVRHDDDVPADDGIRPKDGAPVPRARV